MKVVQINAVFKNGSTGRIVMEVHNKLIADGHDSYVFCSNDYGFNDNKIKLVGSKIDQKIHSLLSRILGLQGYFSMYATRKVLNEIKNINPEIVHLHNLHNNFINLPLLLSFLSKNNIATVLTLHDCWFFTGHCCHFTELKCSKWMTMCHNCQGLNKDNISWFFDLSTKIFLDKKSYFGAIPKLAVIGNSQWTTDQARQSFLKSATFIKQIYNWVDQDIFYPRNTVSIRKKLGFQESDFIVLGVSQNWNKRKGIHVFTKLAKLNPDIKFILIGSLFDTDNLVSNMYSIGRTSNAAELALYYSCANVFISPSIQETFGLVSAESLACGTPIIVNNATANPELVGEKCGYIVDNNNIDEYNKCIDEIRKYGKDYFSEYCVNFARDNFDKKKNLASLESLYSKLLSE